MGLTLNASDYINKSQLSAQETRKLSRAIEAARSPAERFSMEQDRLTKAVNAGAISQGVHNRLLEAARQKHIGAGLAAKQNAMQHSLLMAKFTGLQSQLTSFRSNPAFLATAAGVASITAAVGGSILVMRNAQTEIDETAKAAAKLGLSYRDLKAIQFAGGEIAGASGEQVANALKQMQIRISKAVDGDQIITKAFAKLGLKAGDLMAAGPVESIKMIAAGMEGLGTQSEKLNATADLFGKSGTDIVALLTAGSDVLAESIEYQQQWNGLTDAQVLGVEKFNDELGRAQSAIEGMTATIAAEMAPLMSTMLDQASGIADQFGGIQGHAAGWAESIAMGLGDITDTVSKLEHLKNIISAPVTFDYSASYDSMQAFFAEELSTGEKNYMKLMQKRGEIAFDAAEVAAGRSIAAMDQADVTADATAKLTEEYDRQFFALENQAAALVFSDEYAKRLRMEAEGYSDELITQLEKQQQFVDGLKRELEEREKITAEKKRLESVFESDVTASLKGAQAFFDKQQKQAEDLRKSITKGPESMEVGSAAAAKFMAEQRNRELGATIPDKPTPGEAMIVSEAVKQLAEIQASRAAAERTANAMEQFLAGPGGKGIDVPQGVLDRLSGMPETQPIDVAVDPESLRSDQMAARPMMDPQQSQRQEAIASSGEKQVAALQHVAAKQDRQITILTGLLEAAKENGFRRLR